MNTLKKSILLLLCVAMISCVMFVDVRAEENSVNVVSSPAISCKSAVLMEASTGQILYEMNADEALPPASVTKIMTLLLVMEAIEEGNLKYDDVITASSNACSMGGSQIYLEEGEQMSAEDMIKSVVIASANDAAVALAEHIAGSEEAFVARMNKRAKELGMNNTCFENTNGLDDTVTSHVISARDIAIMSRELIKYDKITEYSSIWMDTIRNGEFGLTNTNRLIRFYKGATGLKTGSTSKAGFCISATAKRGDMTLICVIMGAETRDIRNSSATAMLDWGFSNFAIYNSPEINLPSVKIIGGTVSEYLPIIDNFTIVIPKTANKKINYSVDLPQKISAPLKAGENIGKVNYHIDGKIVHSVDIKLQDDINKMSFYDMIRQILCAIFVN